MICDNIIVLEIAVNTPGKMVSKARLVMCAIDLAARASVLNMKQFNGKWGCTYYEDVGVLRPTCRLVTLFHHLHPKNT